MSGIIRKGRENKAKSFWCCCINPWFTPFKLRAVLLERSGTAFKLQKVQRGAGRLTRSVERLPYDEHARSLSLFALEEGELRASTAKVYKVTNSMERVEGDQRSTLSTATSNTCTQMKLVETKFKIDRRRCLFMQPR